MDEPGWLMFGPLCAEQDAIHVIDSAVGHGNSRYAIWYFPAFIAAVIADVDSRYLDSFLASLVRIDVAREEERVLLGPKDAGFVGKGDGTILMNHIESRLQSNEGKKALVVDKKARVVDDPDPW